MSATASRNGARIARVAKDQDGLFDHALRTRRDHNYRTRLREGAAEGPNFAGRYTVVIWGCGTGCAQMGVVDSKTGRVYFPPIEYVDIIEQGRGGRPQG